MLREELSVALKRCKEYHGLTYDQIEAETGLSKTTIRYAMNGGENVGVNVFDVLLGYFELSIEIAKVKSSYLGN